MMSIVILRTPTTNAVQGYNMFQETPQQLPVYMPQSQLTNYDVNCYSTNTHTGVKQQYNQVPVTSQHEVGGGMYYNQKPAPQVEYTEADNTAIKVQQVADKQVVQENVRETEHVAQNGVSKVVHQEDMYNLNMLDDFPNAQNLETPLPYEQVHMIQQVEEAPQPQPSPQQQSEVQEKPTSSEEDKVGSQMGGEVGTIREQQVAEEIPQVIQNVVPDQQRPRPSAWGNGSKLKIGPNATMSSSKLLVQTASANKRFAKKSPTQLKPPLQEQNPRVNENTMEEASISQYCPVPQPGDIMKGTVKHTVQNLGVFMDINGPDA